MKRNKTKHWAFRALFAFAAVLVAFSPARAQYESFFGGESWEYATAFHPIMKARDYNPELIGCLTNTYSFSRTDTAIINEQKYYKGTFEGLWGNMVQLREDTVNGRLYSLIDSNEYLICDMSLEVGDTFSLPIPTWNSMETMRMVADSVSFVNSKKVIHLSALSGVDAYWWTSLDYSGAFNISLRFMEGVGPTYGIVPPYQDGELLLCLTKDDTLYYMTHPDLGCWQVVYDVPDYPNETLTVYPNPTDDLLNVELSGAGIATVALYDLQGRMVYSQNPSNSPTEHSPTATVNMRNIPAGVYVLRVTDGDGKTYNRKVVRE